MIFRFLDQVLNWSRKSSQSILDVYTDGSHKGRWGSWAFVVVSNNKITHESSGRTKNTNSFRMEFQAVIEALKFLEPRSQVRINSDFKVLVDCFNEQSLRPVKNADLIAEIEQLSRDRVVKWNWVRGHSGDYFNERCDELCFTSRLGLKN